MRMSGTGVCVHETTTITTIIYTTATVINTSPFTKLYSTLLYLYLSVPVQQRTESHRCYSAHQKELGIFEEVEVLPWDTEVALDRQVE